MNIDKKNQEVSLILSSAAVGNRETLLEKCKVIKKPDLVNLLNYINFQDETAKLNFKHLRNNTVISLLVKPQPCLGDTVRCLWTDQADLSFNLSLYAFDSLFLPDGRDLVFILPDKPEDFRHDAYGINFKLPDTGYESRYRSTLRHFCSSITAEVLQHGMLFVGKLLDFHPVSLRLELMRGQGQVFDWIHHDLPLTLLLKQNGTLIYSGECNIIRRHRVKYDREQLVVAPHNKNINRFKAKQFRCIRHCLVPSPAISFRHPFTDRLVSLPTKDLSSSGVAVEEVHAGSTLLPGLIIPELFLSFSSNHTIRCVGQVLYRNNVNQANGDSIVRCGIAFLDMSLSEQLDLSSFLHQAIDQRARVSNMVDLDALWKLFFESGFIYPDKYNAIHTNKEEFKKTYQNLYLKSPAIARHFVFQDHGTLYSHMSMVRFYTNSWLIHHHVGSKIRKGRSGVMVLDQVGFYVNEFSSLISTHMSFVMCYYRKENSFPHKVFGGVAEHMKNPQASSLDSFIYFTVPRDLRCSGIGEEYTLSQASRTDLFELEGFYRKHSGGLMLDALDLNSDSESDAELNDEFRCYGFTRARDIYSLKQNKELRAVITVTRSDLGLNLSNLTNCIHVFLLEKISQLTLYSVLSKLLEGYRQTDIPVMVYPYALAEKIIPDYEKSYTLWVLNLQNSDGYFESLQKTFKRSQYE